MKTFKIFFVLILLILFSSYENTLFSQTYVSGTIYSNTTWDKFGSPYIVTGNVTVNPGIVLTIDSSVIVRFQSGQGLYVKGTLNARHGLFTSAKDTVGGNPTKGDWNFVQVGDYYNSGSITLDTCQIKYGGVSYPSDNGSIYVYSGSAILRSCDISASQNYGMMLTGSANVSLFNSNITSCDWPITYVGAGSLVLNGSNTFIGNTHNGIYMRFSEFSDTFTLDTAMAPTVIPYVFIGDFFVRPGAGLEIAHGNAVKFSNYANLNVEGTLIAKDVTFTAYTDDNIGGDTNGDGTATAPTSSYWGGVVFRDVSNDASCVMRRCKITFAGAGNIGGVSMYNASPTIDSCEMENNYYGALLRDVSNPTFSNNTIGSSKVVPIAMSFTANPIFVNNTLSFSDNRYDAIGLLGSTTPANGVLPIRSVTAIPNITYLLLENVTVPAGNTFTINKGIVIKAAYAPPYFYFAPRIIVQGKLIANATPDSMIVITSSKDDGFGNPFDTNRDGTQSSPVREDWGGITFESTSDTGSTLNYCRIKYGSLPWTYYNTRYISGGAITTINASPMISNCEIKDVVYGIYAFQSSNPKISNTTIINTQYTPIAISVSANPTFSGLTFTNTAWTALGIIGENLGFNGTIKQRDVAGFTNITYVLLEDLTINAGTNVTVDPGVVIKNNAAGIFVNGGFRAKGTVVSGNIVFTSIKDDNYGHPNDSNGDGNATSAAPGDWKTIRFQTTSNDTFSVLDSCIIKFAGNDSYDPIYSTYASWGGVTFTDANTKLSHSLISDSYNFGVRCEGSSMPIVDGVEFKNCRRDPIAMSLKSNPALTNITFTSNGSKGIRIIEGTLSSNATLSKRDVAGITNIAYIVEKLTISSNAVLTIDPGVVIKFPSLYAPYYPHYYNYAGIVVNGAVVAAGTATQKIIFTSLKDDSNGGDTNNDGNNSTPTRGDWWSIEYRNSGSDTLNSLKNCEIRYGGSGGGIYYYYYPDGAGAVRVFDAHVRIDSCIVQQSANSGLGIYGSASPVVSNVQIYNILYTPVMMSLFANPTFSNISALNVGIMALGIVPETYSVSATVPKRDFAGFSNITYFFYTDYYGERPIINSGTTITIPSGVVFKAGVGFPGILVNGALVVQGTSSQKVIFTDVRDDSYGNPFDSNGDGSSTHSDIDRSNRGWVEMSDVSDDSVSSIKYAVFRYREYGIDLLQASPRINNSIFDKTDWGVRLNGVSQPTLDSCSFRNLTYAPIRTSLVSYPRSSNGNVMSGSTYRAIGILEETLVQDVTLPRRSFGGVNNIPYLFGDYTIGTSAVLTISPGVVMKFFPDKRITIRKGLIAEGGAHPDSTIVFTDIKDDFYGGDTNADSNATSPSNTYYPWDPNWWGIEFADESLDPLCRMKHCIIRHAGYYYSDQIGGIVTNSASPTITYSVISNNRYGIIALAASNPLINFCDIYQNTEQGVRNTHKSFNINTKWNWWGSNTGPTHTGNPIGMGDVVTDSVNYIPHRTIGLQVPIAGDVSLNGYIQAYDASLILKFVVDSISNPLNEIQKRVADVSGVSGITSYDASLLLQYIVGNIQSFPIEINRKNLTNVQPSKVVASSIEIGNVHCARGNSIIIPIFMNGVDNIASADITISFDKSILTPTNVQLSPTLSGMSMQTNISDGECRIALAGTEYISINDNVIFISFDVKKDIGGTLKSTIEFSKILLNEDSFDAIAKSGVVSIEGKPTEFSLYQNYPNPFNPVTSIRYQIPEDETQVTITIYNAMGQLVRTLLDEKKDAGEFEIIWNGCDEELKQVSSGLYFYRISAVGVKNYNSIKKMLLIR
ncbi:MAG: right-handed parallel beta-helix repeat-containing protein [Bacteroidota bacterium]|nr:right-handed parallel beta-helix repeat-containing protein [Bacteroidota bacterium]